jgi:hypothetical protein
MDLRQSSLLACSKLGKTVAVWCLRACIVTHQYGLLGDLHSPHALRQRLHLGLQLCVLGTYKRMPSRSDETIECICSSSPVEGLVARAGVGTADSPRPADATSSSSRWLLSSSGMLAAIAFNPLQHARHIMR